MAWSDYITRLRREWIGKTVKYQGKPYMVVDVDINGMLHINKPHYYCESYTSETTAVETHMIEKGE